MLVGIGPFKSICSSWFGSCNGDRVPKWDFDIKALRILPWSVHCLQFSARSLIVRWMWGNQIKLADHPNLSGVSSVNGIHHCVLKLIGYY